MGMETSQTIAIYPSPDGSGTLTVPGVTFIPTGPVNPHVCPSCGRCRSCGQPALVPAPLNPWPQYVEPLWLVDPNTGPFYGSAAGIGYQATLT